MLVGFHCSLNHISYSTASEPSLKRYYMKEMVHENLRQDYVVVAYIKFFFGWEENNRARVMSERIEI